MLFAGCFLQIGDARAAFSPPVGYKAALQQRAAEKAAKWQERLYAAPTPKPPISKRNLGVLLLIYAGLYAFSTASSLYILFVVAIAFGGATAIAGLLISLGLLWLLLISVPPVVYGILLIDGSYVRLSPNPIVAWQRIRRECVWGLLTTMPTMLFALAGLTSALITLATLNFQVLVVFLIFALLAWASFSLFRRLIRARRAMQEESYQLGKQ